jgi:hypothetical protein
VRNFAPRQYLLTSMMQELFSAAWGAFVPAMTTQTQKEGEAQVMAFRLAKAFRYSFAEGSKPRLIATEMVQNIATSVISNARAALMANTNGEELDVHVAGLLNLVRTFEGLLFDGAQLAQVRLIPSAVQRQLMHYWQLLHETVEASLYKLAGVSPALLVTYISRSKDRQLWQKLLGVISARPSLVYSALPALADAAERGALPTELQPSEQALDAAMSKLFEDVAKGTNVGALPLFLRVVQHYGAFSFCSCAAIQFICFQCTFLAPVRSRRSCTTWCQMRESSAMVFWMVREAALRD